MYNIYMFLFIYLYVYVLFVSVLFHHTKFMLFVMLVFCSHEILKIQTAEVQSLHILSLKLT